MKRTGFWSGLIVFVALAFPGSALAGPADLDQDRTTSEANALEWTSQSIALELYTPSLYDAQHQEQSYQVHLPPAMPEDMSVHFRIDPTLTIYLASDLDDELPRLDAVDGQTYFSVGAKVHLTHDLSLFVEDFQMASGVTGTQELEEDPAPERSWDGHQISLGASLQATDQLEVRGEVIGYVMSLSDRQDTVGGVVSFTYRF